MASSPLIALVLSKWRSPSYDMIPREVIKMKLICKIENSPNYIIVSKIILSVLEWFVNKLTNKSEFVIINSVNKSF